MPIVIQSPDEINVQFSLSGSITIGTGNTNPGTAETDPTVPAHVKSISTADINNWNAKADEAYTDNAIGALKDGVPSAGDTMMKLFNLFVGLILEVTVNDIAERDAYHAITGMHLFVLDDGDGKWALYKATSSGVGASYIKLSDPDLLNAVMTAAQIKAAYESNPDTNALTDALLAKLNGALDKNTFTNKILDNDYPTNNTSMEDVVGSDNDHSLNFNVQANKRYSFSFSGRIGGSATHGGRFGITAPPGALVEWQVIGNLGSNGTAVAPSGRVAGQETSTFASAASGSMYYMFWIKGTLANGATDGVVQLVARSINTGNTFTIFAGALVEAREI